MKILPILLILLLFLGANFYLFFRLWQMMPPSMPARVALVAFAVVAVSSFFVSFLLEDTVPASVMSFLYKLGTAWIFIFLYLLMTVLLLDLLKLTHLLPLDKFLHANWVGFISVVGFVAVVMTIANIRYQNKDRVELNLSLNKQGAGTGNVPLKVVMISDVHLGYGIGKKEFGKWVELINAENPDLILIAGDLIDNSVKPLYDQQMQEELGMLRSTYGVYACAGNHEYIANLQKSMEFLKGTNVTLLRDSAQLIDNRFYVLGRDDRMNPNRRSIAELTEGLDRSKPILMLDHQPYHLEEAEQNGIDLQLSGHTHRGQVWPVNWITDMLYEVSHGYKQKGNSHIYVSSGLGLWGGKFRIGSRSEYVVLNLQ